MANKSVKDVEEEVVELDGLEIDEPKAKKVKKDVKENISNDDDYEEVTVEDRIVSIEKRTNAIFVLAIVIIIIGLLNTLVIVNRTSDSTSSSSSEESSTTESGYDTSSFDEITGDEIESLSKNDTIVVLIARQTCSYCSAYAPIIASVQEDYGFTTKYIDLAKMIDMNASSLTITDQDSYDGLFNVGTDKTCISTAVDSNGDAVACEDFISTEFGATPLTLVIKNNKLVYAIAGYVDATTLAEHLEAAGFSK